MTILLSGRNIHKHYGDKKILDNVSFDIKVNEKIGLVGRNGTGKTTLMNLIYTGALDKGQLIWHDPSITIGYLKQVSAYIDETEQEETMSSNNKDYLFTASQLGVAKEIYKAEGNQTTLSGGEHTKLQLASIWSARPALLLLDEPTNHMDAQGIQWLIEQLQAYQGTYITISHNRYFLDQVVDRIIEIEQHQLHSYTGNYTDYRKQKEETIQAQWNAYDKQEKYNKKVEEDIQRISRWANQGHQNSGKKAIENGGLCGLKTFYRSKSKKLDRQAQSKLKRLEQAKIEGIAKPQAEQHIKFHFNDGEKRGKLSLEAKRISKSYGNHILFEKSSFTIQRGGKVGLIGENGSGKTTLIQCILQQQSLDEGTLLFHPHLRMSYLSQDVIHMNEQDDMLSLFHITNSQEEATVRSQLVHMGFKKDMLHQSIGSLSLGERMKLKIAQLLFEDHDLLILDEPTNHLDLNTREQLEQALQHYKGTLLLVTHDRYMLEKICNTVLVIEHKHIKKFPYSFKEYVQKSKQEHKQPLKNAEPATKEKQEERLLRIQHQLTTVLSQLSLCSPHDPMYKQLDEEFKALLAEKQQYNQ
ncbi:ribosomal protection-like ABC-F family protein [Longirhabdus pacifica]|uniref:ribosomal protection-like ABC-F family protein n=1 Tax=Longirhabdus pacifica TaxID=2305227 RepID=UPI0013E8C471|nr:ABC-F type ribosomal protection protein [Longirhabdus pacifica]